MHDTECPYWDYVSLNKKNSTPWSHGNKHYWVHGDAKVCPYCLMNEWKCHSLLIYWMNTYCRVLDVCKSFTARVSWGSFLRQWKSRNIMLAYESRMPDLTLAQLKHWKRQTYHNHKLKCLGTLSILQHICSHASKYCESLVLRFSPMNVSSLETSFGDCELLQCTAKIFVLYLISQKQLIREI